jgi:hypothetical protein
MEEFAEASQIAAVRERLFRALAGRGAFRRFKDAVSEWPALREAWFAYRDHAHREWIRDWLNSLGIDPVDASPDRLPPLPARW